MGNSTLFLGAYTTLLGVFGGKFHFTRSEKFNSTNVNAQRIYAFDGTNTSPLDFPSYPGTQHGITGQLVAYNNMVSRFLLGILSSQALL